VNATQVILLLSPVVLGYLYFVWKAESQGKVNHWVNLFSGLIVVPLFVGFIPFILLAVSFDLLRKRQWGEWIMTTSFLLLIGGYGALILHLRDRPPPSPHDLPVEQPLEATPPPVEKK
jgi:hypothetical protein